MAEISLGDGETIFPLVKNVTTHLRHVFSNFYHKREFI